MMHGLWIVLAAALLVPVLDLIPLAALAALVMAVGIQMVNITHVRSITRHREFPVYATTVVVILTSVFFGLYLFGVDLLIGRGVEWLLRRFGAA